MAVIGVARGPFQLVLIAVVLWTMGGVERIGARLRGDHGEWRGDDEGRGEGDDPNRQRVEYIAPPQADRDPSTTHRPVVFVWRP